MAILLSTLLRTLGILSEMVEPLLLKGAEIDALAGFSWTLFFTAILFYHHAAVVLALLAAGAAVNLPCGTTRGTALHSATSIEKKNGHREGVGRARGGRVNAGNIHSDAALHRLRLLTTSTKSMHTSRLVPTSEHGIWKAVQHLFMLLPPKSSPTHVNAQSGLLGTPLHFAAARAGTEGSVEVVNLLLRWSADETIVDGAAFTALDVLEHRVEEEKSLVGDAERVRELLANDPIDRAWLVTSKNTWFSLT